MTPEAGTSKGGALSNKTWRRALRPRWIISSGILFVICGGTALLWLPQPLLDNWLVGQTVDAATARLAITGATQTVLFGLGGLIALIGVGLSLSRHGLELDAADNDQAKEDRRVAELTEQVRVDAAKELRSRFAGAVALLSDNDRATTRQAGVYALGALADDWQQFGRLDERQVCIDVLCGYLRSKWDPTSGTADDERRIRSAAFNLIAGRLRPSETGQAPQWERVELDFTGAILDFRVHFGGAVFSGRRVSFENAVFSGDSVSFKGATFASDSVTFSQAIFSGDAVSFANATFTGDRLSFLGVTFSGIVVGLDGASFTSEDVSFRSAQFLSHRISFRNTEFPGKHVAFSNARFSGNDLDFNFASFSGYEVRFDNAVFDGGKVHFDDAILSASKIYFRDLIISGKGPSFRDARLQSGIVQINGPVEEIRALDVKQISFEGGVFEVNGRESRRHPIDFSGAVKLSHTGG
jgi:uncharacterized protein YjbI with pentapeptide repeats